MLLAFDAAVMTSMREMMMGTWEFQPRGNAKSAGTHDAPIPGMITSRRVHKVPKKAPEVKQPQVRYVLPPPKKEKKRKRSRSRKRHKSSSSSEDDKKEVPRAPEEDHEAIQQRELREQREREEIRRQQNAEAEETRRRKEQAAEWARQQAEREARRAEEQRLAEEQRQKHAARDAARRQNLKGAFAVAGEELDEETATGKERAKRQAEQKQQQKSSKLSLALREDPAEAVSSSSSKEGQQPQDAVSLRAALADPSAVRSFAAGEVAEKYKLLMEMKRKFRRADFGGPTEKREKKDRSRSRSRRRGSGRSPSSSRYDSLWIRPR